MFCEHRGDDERPQQTMAFSPNPLSLSVPDPAFESWLRDSGYLDLLDHRTSAAAAASAAPASSSSSAAAAPSSVSDDVVSSITGGFFASLLSRLVTVSSLLTINPFSKLSADDFSGDTPPWTTGFFGACDSYSFPASSQQARMRVHENIKRFARNYATLFIVFFACALYQMPLALVGLLASLALWELFKYCSDRWKFDRHPSARRLVIGIGQCATMVFLTFLNVQMALFYALAVSYSVMLLHAGFRKLTPSKKPSRGR